MSVQEVTPEQIAKLHERMREDASSEKMGRYADNLRDGNMRLLEKDPYLIDHHNWQGDKDWAELLDAVRGTDMMDATTDPYMTLTQALIRPGSITRSAPNLTATDITQFKNMLTNLKAGDWLIAKGVKFSSQINVSKALPSWARVTIDPSCVLSGISTMAQYQTPQFYFRNAQYLQWIMDGVDAHNPGGDFILVHGGCHHLVIDGFYAHDLGNDGCSIFPSEAEVHHMFVRGHVMNIGTHLPFDPHPEKGTGQHGMNFQDSNHYSCHDNVLAIFCEYSGKPDRSSGGGSCLECGVLAGGAQPYNNHFYVKGHVMHYKAQVQTGGNAVNMWGGTQHDNTWHIIELEDAMGHGWESAGMNSGAILRNCVVNRGIAVNTLQNPYEAAKCQGKTWCTKGGAIFQSVS